MRETTAGEARLINTAGAGGDGPLAMGRFADRLRESAAGRVVYHESHDEAGGGNPPTARTIAVAVGVNRNTDYNDALINQFRRYAEGRVHFAAGVTLLGPGTPMFFMGEEVGCWQPYRYNDFLNHRDDLPGMRRRVSDKQASRRPGLRSTSTFTDVRLREDLQISPQWV